jgi:hypothetical protein
MLQTRLKSTLLGASIAVAAMLGAVGPAHAVAYKGAWDPGYGAPFSQMGWRGEGLFEIPDACLGSSGWVANGDECSSGGMKMVSGTLSFYDVDNSSVDLETFALNPSVFIYEMFVDNGVLTGVSSGFLQPVVPTLAIAGGGAFGFHQQFLREVSPQNTPSVQLYYTAGTPDPTCLFRNPPTCEGGMSETKAILVLTPAVPEPETYALMLAGLAAIGFIARRRRA